jgi:DNA methylase
MRNPLHSICPYFAMFPESFVAEQVEKFTGRGDVIFDPFCGRGTAILQSLLMDRNAAGTDINPVAYCVSAAKAKLPSLASAIYKIDVLQNAFRSENEADLSRQRRSLPLFFKHAFQPSTLGPILFLRRVLDWRNDPVDRFVATLILGALHGEMDKSSSYLSNQMPRTISTKPNYSISYWRRHRLKPPRRDVFALLRAKANYRLAAEVPSREGFVAMVDAREAAESFPMLARKVKAVITSPPYLNVTRYEEDQWLRLWFLGHEPGPTYGDISKDDRHVGHDNYWEFLSESWAGIRPLMGRNSVLVCRLAGKDVTRKELTDNLYETVLLSFPRAYLVAPPKASKIRPQHRLYFQPNARGCRFEIDYVFRLN